MKDVLEAMLIDIGICNTRCVFFFFFSVSQLYADEFVKKSLRGEGSAAAREQEARAKEELQGLFHKVGERERARAECCLDVLIVFALTARDMLRCAGVSAAGRPVSLQLRP
jgi:hypothetical protein